MQVFRLIPFTVIQVSHYIAPFVILGVKTHTKVECVHHLYLNTHVHTEKHTHTQTCACVYKTMNWCKLGRERCDLVFILSNMFNRYRYVVRDTYIKLTNTTYIFLDKIYENIYSFAQKSTLKITTSF